MEYSRLWSGIDLFSTLFIDFDWPYHSLIHLFLLLSPLFLEDLLGSLGHFGWDWLGLVLTELLDLRKALKSSMRDIPAFRSDKFWREQRDWFYLLAFRRFCELWARRWFWQTATSWDLFWRLLCPMWHNRRSHRWSAVNRNVWR